MSVARAGRTGRSGGPGRARRAGATLTQWARYWLIPSYESRPGGVRVVWFQANMVFAADEEGADRIRRLPRQGAPAAVETGTGKSDLAHGWPARRGPAIQPGGQAVQDPRR